jgi:hypothetical protein
MKPMMIAAAAMLATACSRDRIVKIGWDPPPVMPDHYRILVDGDVVREILPPPLNAECKCLMVFVPVPRGRHIVSVVAYSDNGGVSPSASVTVQ